MVPGEGERSPGVLAISLHLEALGSDVVEALPAGLGEPVVVALGEGGVADAEVVARVRRHEHQAVHRPRVADAPRDDEHRGDRGDDGHRGQGAAPTAAPPDDGEDHGEGQHDGPHERRRPQRRAESDEPWPAGDATLVGAVAGDGEPGDQGHEGGEHGLVVGGRRVEDEAREHGDGDRAGATGADTEEPPAEVEDEDDRGQARRDVHGGGDTGRGGAVPDQMGQPQRPAEESRVAHGVVGRRRTDEERPVAVAACDVLGVVQVGEGIAEGLGPPRGVQAPRQP